MGFRITPAYAGKTSSLVVIGNLAMDHPRIRGKDSSVESRKVKLTGITPAYAGKTRLE